LALLVQLDYKVNKRTSKMAVGKNKRLTKGKKGGKKKAQDPFLRKEMYNIKAPSIFVNRNAGKTLITKTTGIKIASEGLKGRVFQVSLADLNGGDETQAYRKINLVCEDVQGYNVMTNFNGMDMTRDKLNSLIRKWQSLIEAQVEVRTIDGYYLRIFAIAFTKKQNNQAKEHLLCTGWTNPKHPQEDVRDYERRGKQMRLEGTRTKAYLLT